MIEKLKPCKCDSVPKVRKRIVEQTIDYIKHKRQYKFYIECPDCGYWYDVVLFGSRGWVLNQHTQVVAWQYIMPPKEEE